MDSLESRDQKQETASDRNFENSTPVHSGSTRSSSFSSAQDNAMPKNTGIKLLVLISFLLMIVLNALANILPINGISTGEVSDSYANLFAPAGFTFSIWGVIYLLLAFFTIYQFRIKSKNISASTRLQASDSNTSSNQFEQAVKTDGGKIRENVSINYVRVLFIISSIINAVWILAWHYDSIGLSLILMLCLLVCLILIHSHLKKLRLGFGDKLLIKLPFSIYLGWITVATVANVTTWLVAADWQGWGISEQAWTVAVIIVATLIALAVVARSFDAAYGLVIIWAYAGIISKHLDSAGHGGSYSSVIITVSIAIAVMAVAVLLSLFGKKLKMVSGKKISRSNDSQS